MDHIAHPESMNQPLEREKNPVFDSKVEPGGYLWWYLDGISDDEKHAITIIVFVGSVFSPYYRHARKKGQADAHNYCAFNVALYGRPGKRWCMTERGSRALQRDRSFIQIGPSTMRWTGEAVELDLNEISVPWPARIRGRVRLTPKNSNPFTFCLDAAQRHFWQPIFPEAEIEVQLQNPNLSWRGSAYLDTNTGSVPLENDFIDWNWSRLHMADGGSRILYDRRLVSGDRHCLTVEFDRHGKLTEFPPDPEIELPRTHIWRIPRASRGHLNKNAKKAIETLEDTPFYARSLVNMEHHGEAVTAVHESLSMSRFNQDWVHLLLPFRMPRLAR